MKTYSVKNRISKQAKTALQEIIDFHKKHQAIFFWEPGKNATQRRNNEKKFEENAPRYAFKTKDGLLKADFEYNESCNNVYYKGIFTLDGRKVTISEFKKLLEKA